MIGKQFYYIFQVHLVAASLTLTSVLFNGSIVLISLEESFVSSFILQFYKFSFPLFTSPLTTNLSHYILKIST